MQLNRQFTKNHFLPRLSALAISNAGILDRFRVIDEILDIGSERFGRVKADLVNTRSNLNYGVLKEICVICGIAADSFTSYETFIDKILLQRRNAIAHGEDTLVAISELDTIINTTIEIIRLFGDELENHVCKKAYLAQSQATVTLRLK
jgi:hypothetical protein